MRRHLFLTLATSLCLAAAAAGAQPASPAPAGKLALPSNFQVAGTLRVGLFLTDRFDAFLEAIRQGKVDQGQLTVTKARIGQTLSAPLLFTGCKPGVTQTCTVSAVFRVRPPKGQVVETGRVYVWGGAAPAASSIQLADNPFGFTLDPTDPLGTYRVEADITDHNANLTVKVSTDFSVSR